MFAALGLNSVHETRRITAKAALAALEEFAAVSADQAAAWVDATVVDLDSAKGVQKKMARAIVHLRDVVLAELAGDS